MKIKTCSLCTPGDGNNCHPTVITCGGNLLLRMLRSRMGIRDGLQSKSTWLVLVGAAILTE